MARRRADGGMNPAKAGGYDPDRMKITPPKVATGGNAKCDQGFMEDEAESLSLIDQDSKPDDCYWDVLYQWDGLTEDLDDEYWEQFRRSKNGRKCTGIAYVRDERGGYIMDADWERLQRPCLRPPLNGAHVCNKHGGQVAHVREAAINRLSNAAEKAANTLITLTDIRDETGELVDQKVRVSAANSVLDRVGVKGGSTVEVEIPGYKDVLSKLFGEEE